MNDLLAPTSTDSNFLTQLVGDDKKFKSAEDLARGKFESDNYIKILETRLDEMREDMLSWKKEADSRANLQEFIDQMKPQTTSTQTQATISQDTKPSFDPSQVSSIVSSEVQKLRAQERETENYNLVLNKLKQVHGENYASQLKKQAQELNLTDDRVNELARKEPALFMRTFGLDTQPRRQESLMSPPPSSVRNESFRPQTEEVRDWSYYQKLKQEMGPQFYYDKKLAIQMHNDALALGDRFNTGDFNLGDRDLMRRLDTYTHSVVRQ